VISSPIPTAALFQPNLAGCAYDLVSNNNPSAGTGLHAANLRIGAPVFATPMPVNNGGSTPTLALMAGSTFALSPNPGPYANADTDQRGVRRTSPPDLGAYQLSVHSVGIGTTTLLEASGAGNDSVVLSDPNGSWTAATNAAWLHFPTASGSFAAAANSASIPFTFDSNAGAPRTGTITLTITHTNQQVVNLTETVTQAGSTLKRHTPSISWLAATPPGWPCRRRASSTRPIPWGRTPSMCGAPGPDSSPSWLPRA